MLREMKLGLIRFCRWYWSLPPKVKWPGIAVVAILVIVIGASSGGGTSDKPKAAAPAVSTQVGAKATDTSKATADVAAPLSPSPSSTAVLSFAAQVEKSIRDNQDAVSSGANFDNLQLAFDSGLLTVSVRPNSLKKDTELLTNGSALVIISGKAAWTTYAEVQRISVQVFKNGQNGQPEQYTVAEYGRDNGLQQDWAALKKQPDRYTLWSPERTQMQIFSEWLERLNRSLNFEDDGWLLEAAVSHIKRSAPSNDWDKVLSGGVRRVQLSRQVEDSWRYQDEWLYVSPGLYGDVIMVQHLISRSHQHGGRTFEGRLTFQELIRRLRRIGYFEAKSINASDPYEEFENAIGKLVDSGPGAVYYAVDRKDYLDKLKSVYEKKREK